MNRSEHIYARYADMIDNGASELELKKFAARSSMLFRRRYHMRLAFD